MQKNPLPRKGRAPIVAASIMLCLALLLAPGAFAAGPHCTVPYLHVQDGASATLPDPTNQFSIEYVKMGEPFVSCTTKQLTAILKVPTMDPGGGGTAQPPPNASWTVEFVIPGSAVSTGVPKTIFIQYDTTIVPTGGFNWGFYDSVNDINLSQCLPGLGSCEVTGNVTSDGTITMNFNLTAALALSDFNGNPVGSIGGSWWTPGTQISNIQGQTQRFIGAVGTGFSVNDATTIGNGVYTVQGNVSCSNPPTAALSSNITSGNAPLTVNFDASASTNVGGCGTLNSYIFDFGDGQMTTQATPTVSHTYTNPGTYPARVRVTNTAGLTSANIAQVNITVNSVQPPALSAVVSRQTHGSAGDFDIVMPQPPATRGVECRSNGGNYKLVFTFLHNVVSVASATVTTGIGSVGSSVLGPNSNQYTVNLTGVTNAQNLTVTLTNVVDSSGASGNVPAIMGVLIGDTTGNASVNSSDIGEAKTNSGLTTTSANFRTDVTINGSINSSDIGTIKAQSGTSLP